MKIHVHILNSFTTSEKGGNPAGIVLDADGLTDTQMGEIAHKVGLSETAFVTKNQREDFLVRFFTPSDEVDLCGHATIAAFNLLRDLGHIQANNVYRQETKAGLLDVLVNYEGVLMEQKPPEFGEEIDKKEIEQCFPNVSNFLGQLPIQIVSTGLKDILVPVSNLKALQQLKPDMNKIIEISRKYDVIGIHAFTLDTVKNSCAHTRNFAPLYGIDEESATGTSNGALACYLNKYIDNRRMQYKIEQGYGMNMPSEIIIKLELNEFDNSITAVYVGGRAIITQNRWYYL